MKPSCYKCMYRGTIPGDAHSCCRHPSVHHVADTFAALADALSGKSSAAMRELGIEANAHGIRNGWFFWPANFDPVWLEACNGYKERTANETIHPSDE
jgi:hypothetical protein